MYMMEIMTFILALATVWLAVSTYHLAKVTKETLDLERRPYLAFQNLSFRLYLYEDKENSNDLANIQVGLILKNPCKVPIKYEVVSMRCTFDNHTINEPKFKNKGTLVGPGDTVTFYYDTIPRINIGDQPKNGIVEYEITYHNYDSTEPSNYYTCKKIEYSLFPSQNTRVEISKTPIEIIPQWIILEQDDKKLT